MLQWINILLANQAYISPKWILTPQKEISCHIFKMAILTKFFGDLMNHITKECADKIINHFWMFHYQKSWIYFCLFLWYPVFTFMIKDQCDGNDSTPLKLTLTNLEFLVWFSTVHCGVKGASLGLWIIRKRHWIPCPKLTKSHASSFHWHLHFLTDAIGSTIWKLAPE